MENQEDSKHQLVKQLFRYLQAFNELRNPITRHLNDQHWHLWLRDLPKHETVRLHMASSSSDQQGSGGDEDTGAFTLKVSRPTITSAPHPPEAIRSWLKEGWERIDGEVFVRRTIESVESDGSESNGKTVAFGDDPERVRQFESWELKRSQWVLEERPVRLADQLFERIYDLYSDLERESERFELVLGNGILNQRSEEGSIHHPLLFKRLSLTFDPEVPAFTFAETEHAVDVYSSLLRCIPQADLRRVRERREELEEDQLHPLDEGETRKFLRDIIKFIDNSGVFVEQGRLQGEKEYPRLSNDPVLFVRSRVLGYAVGLDQIMERLDKDPDIPGSLLSISGMADLDNEISKESASKEAEEPEFLLSKPANPEQIRVVKRLEQFGAVIVQGPPGTGKTHTIANLVGHLLAQGKSVLVTSQTSRALARVRDQLVEPIRSFCVSVLGSDARSQEELKHSIESIAELIQEVPIETLDADVSMLTKQREECKERLQEARRFLLEARSNEYTQIMFRGKGILPAKAARWVAAMRYIHGWIPELAVSEESFPLTMSEIHDLYRTNESISRKYEKEIEAGLPEIDNVPAPREFRKWVEDYKALNTPNLQHGKIYWKHENAEVNALIQLGKRFVKTFRVIKGADRRKLEMLEVGRVGGDRLELWNKLLSSIEELASSANAAEDLLVTHAPQLDTKIPLREQYRVLSQVVAHLEKKGKVGWITLMRHPDWKKILETVQVGRGKPESLEEYKALKTLAELSGKREQLLNIWKRMAGSLGGKQRERFSSQPERILMQHIPAIAEALNWYQASWSPQFAELKRVGFDWEAWERDQPVLSHEHGVLKRIQAFAEVVKDFLNAQIGRLTLNDIRSKITSTHDYLENQSKATSSWIAQELLKAILDGQVDTYETWYNRLSDVIRARESYENRRVLLDKLATGSEAWARAIEERTPPHDRNEPPGDLEKALMWAHLNHELDRRSDFSADLLQNEINEARKELGEITAELVYKSAWAAQVRRLKEDPRRQQALIGWQDTMRKIGAGTGKRVRLLRRKARQLMAQCKSTVPVWVMPMASVLENFNLSDTRFDVVIIDEASQLDVMGLMALFMGEKVVVVGDHEQVSPSAVGQDLEKVQDLIDELLKDIPNAHLYDGRTSVYDLARQSFGGVIGLREHYRCVPEVIQFSNALSYNFSIKPLRDASAVKTRPFLVSHFVPHGRAEQRVNHAEAMELSALLVACTEQPEYEGKTFGVITMVGERQADIIRGELRKHLSPVEYEQVRRIRCGNSAHFQGDERDVMFLSVVHSSKGNLLPLVVADRYKQRFNVAASRARDQMWVIHSLDPGADLKEGDLRRRLIEHAINPQALLSHSEPTEEQAEAEFEKEVQQRLLARGYRVVPHWQVGAYRIDLVVEGVEGKKLAIECDGDRYYPLEKLQSDMERQSVLERLGWRFLRVLGSAFFRDPDAEMESIIAQLENLGIQPVGSSEQAPVEAEESLVERVQKRAAELLQSWSSDSTSHQNGAPGSASSRSAGSQRVREKMNGKYLSRPVSSRNT